MKKTASAIRYEQRHRVTRLSRGVRLALAFFPLQALAEAAPEETSFSPIVVPATRSAQPAFDVPASIDSVSLEDPTANTPARRDLFLALRKVLVFPPAGDKRRFDSPVDFRPEKYQQALQPLATEFRSPDAP